MKSKKRKNPPDLTRRNNNARKRELAILRDRIDELERRVKWLLDEIKSWR